MISIITPSFGQPEWLRLCMASVADQQGVAVEHIIQDNNSGPEVSAVAHEFPRARFICEPDSGMYDAVNRGLRRATGEICAYLNCDEQYLPGALAAVQECFDRDPAVDVLFGDVVVTDSDGDYLCSRHVVVPNRYHTAFCHLNTCTAATFFRRRLLDRDGAFFNTRYRTAADAAWVLRLIHSGVSMRLLRRTTSTFTETGANLGLGEEARRERVDLRNGAPSWAAHVTPFWALHHRIRRWLRGAYSPTPFAYSIYTRASPSRRQTFRVDKPTGVWKGRLSWSG